MSEKKKQSSLVADMLSMLPGWALLLMIDPWTATVAGVPLSAVLIALRLIWWEEYPRSGRVVVGVAMPFIALFSASLGVFGSTGPLLGMLLAAAVLALAEGWNRRFGRSLVRGFPLVTGALFLLLSIIFSTLVLESWVTRYPTEDFLKELSAAPEAPKWSASAKEQAVKIVHEAIARDSATPENARHLHDDNAAEMADLVAAESRHGVFVTLYEKSGYRSSGHASTGRNSLERIARAAAQAIQQAPTKPRSNRTRPRMWGNPDVATRVQIDVAGPSKRITYRPLFRWFGEAFRGADRSLRKIRPLGRLFNLAFEIEVGIDGIEILRDDKSESALMLPGEPVTRGWMTPRRRSAPAKVGSMLRRTFRLWFEEELNLEHDDYVVRKFRTACFGEPKAGAKVVDWYRGNVLFDGDLTREMLVERTVLATDWLSRQVQTKGDRRGRFHYEIFPPHKGGTKDYNLPRHAGSIYGLLALYRAAAQEPAFSAAGKRALDAGLVALDYVKGSLGTPDPVNAPDALCFLDEKGRAASGSTALAAMSVVELPEAATVKDPALKARVEAVPVDKWLAGMGDCMLAMIDPDGAVFFDYNDASKNERVKKEPLYFPGEVMLALVRTYERTKDERFLEGAKRIGDRQQRLNRIPLLLDLPIPGDHWIIQAQGQLSQVNGDHRYAELSVLMGRGYLREQFPPQEYLYPDYRGAYRRVADLPRTTRAGSRGEALGAAMEAARFLGEDTTKFENGLIEGARHLIEQQFVRDNSHFIPDEFDVEGGIRMGLVDNHLRIDNNQHGLVALLRALQAMDYREGR